MGYVFRRYNKLWLQYVDENRKRVRISSGYSVGEERKARKLLRRLEDKAAARREAAAHGEPGPPTVARFAEKWIEERRTLRLTDCDGDWARLRLHALPDLGPLKLEEVRPRHLVTLFTRLRAEGKLAPKTIYNVYSVCKALFRDAQLADLIDASPCILTKYQLGPNEDKDSGWRDKALYSRAELQTLISDERIPEDRRVLYALEGLGALRHGEAAGLTWGNYNADAKPLGSLIIATSYDKGRTKTGRTRRMPVHPTLAAILAEWKLRGWPALFGRQPGPDDLVVPVAPGGKAPAGSMRKAHNTWLALQGDLDTLELRHRRGHDLRRTMISLARTDGARKDILELCTHNPGKRSAIDLYTTFPWESLCAEVAKLRVTRRELAEVVAIAAHADAKSASRFLRVSRWPATGAATAARRSDDYRGSLASPRGTAQS